MSTPVGIMNDALEPSDPLDPVFTEVADAEKLAEESRATAEGSDSDLRKAGGIKGGLAWSMIARIGSQVLQLAFSVVLARVLLPAEFGAIGMLLVCSGFAQLLADTGLGAALIQRQSLTEVEKSTVFWFQLTVSLLISAVFLFCAPLFADFFRNQTILPLARAMAAVFAIGAVGQIHGTLLRRTFNFRFLAVAQMVSTLVTGLIAVGMAVAGYGVWALMWQMIIGSILSSALNWIGYRWVPKLLFSWKAMRDLGSYGIFLMGFTSLNYWMRNGDNLIIGRYLGEIDLGIYTRAYSLMLLPIGNISGVFGEVLFPALSRLQDDMQAFRALYIKSIRLIAFATFPMMAGVGLLSDEIVLIMYGQKWAAMIPVLRILALVGLIQSIIFPVGWVYMSLGKTRYQFIMNIFFLMIFTAAMFFGIKYGIIGVTIGYALWNVVTSLANLEAVRRIIHMPHRRLLQSLWKIALATGVMSISVFALQKFLAGRLPIVVEAVPEVILGAATYGLTCLILREDALSLAISTVQTRLRRNSVTA